LSLDIRKAFDTISHQYINMAYRFFNFGENFIKWLNLIGTNRRACIILENGQYSTYFDLERGNAQGDTTSPYIFNIGYQILIFKMNYDLQIPGLIEPPDVPPDIQPIVPHRQVNASPHIMFAFADDRTIVTTMDFASLSRIKYILEDFSKISGLECNVEKTTLMQFGAALPITEEIRSLGFEISNSMTILGLKINGDSLDFQENWEKILLKVRNQIRHWIRFNLSLTGRINIAKTMLYSQINYLGCFLPVPEQVMELLEELIEDFVKGSLQIGKKRLYLSPESGGLGLFQIEPFLTSQKIAWTVRALNLDEIWKIRMYVFGNGNVLNYRSSFIDRNKTPILHGFATAYEKFLCAYTRHKENFWETSVFENMALFVRLRERAILSADFFTPLFWAENKGKILKLTVQDFFVNKDVFKTWEQFKNTTGLELDREAFNNLKKTASNAKLKYIKKETNDKKRFA
jgi:hypothetical protein